MRIPADLVGKVRDAVLLSSIVGRTVQWDKRKTRAAKADYWAICPFHAENTPSFHVDDRRGTWHCFSCGAHGDHFGWLIQKLGMSFPDAVAEVAGLAGIPLPQDTPEARATSLRRMTLIEANQTASIWYQKQLQASEPAMAYLAARGLTQEEIAKYRLGYAPHGSSLLRANVGPVEAMVDAGVLARRDEDQLYDRFRDRIMFPILDDRAREIAFSGRAMGTQEPKYLNSPETEIFSKGATLYGSCSARQQAWDGAALVLVEGNVDVIASGRLGYAACAPLGTALNTAQVHLLTRMAEETTFCFDGDPAGRAAASKAIDLVLPLASPTFAAKFADLPSGEDPDSLVRRSPDGYHRAIDGALGLADALWRRETAGVVLGVPEQRARLEARLRGALRTIRDGDTRKAYGDNFKDRLAALGGRPKVYRSNSYSHHSTGPATSRLMAGYRKSAGLSLRETILIGVIVAAPQMAMQRIEAITADDRLSPEALSVIGWLTEALTNAPEDSDVASIIASLADAGLEDIARDAIATANNAGLPIEIGTEAQEAITILSQRTH